MGKAICTLLLSLLRYDVFTAYSLSAPRDAPAMLQICEIMRFKSFLNYFQQNDTQAQSMKQQDRLQYGLVVPADIVQMSKFFPHDMRERIAA